LIRIGKIIGLNNINKKYGINEELFLGYRPSTNILKTRFIVFVGPSGCGKSQPGTNDCRIGR